MAKFEESKYDVDTKDAPEGSPKDIARDRMQKREMQRKERGTNLALGEDRIHQNDRKTFQPKDIQHIKSFKFRRHM